MLGPCLALLVGCKPPTFDPASRVQSLRILTTSADAPYATPGQEVKMSVLAFDGRIAPAEPMNLYWVPRACVNPPADAYYACFPGFAGALDPRTDLGPTFNAGTTFSFEMPSDVIATHVGASGTDPYGIAVVFTIACAGRVEYVPPPAHGSPDAVPFGCFDAAGNALGPDDFVFAYSLVYSFADRTNANPAIDHLTFGGTAVDSNIGITVDHCALSNIDDCPATQLDVVVPASSQEPDPGNLDSGGRVLNEEIYVQYFVTGGKLANDTTVLFDPRTGRLSDTGNDFRAPNAAGDYRLWAIVHDNRGGVTWQELPLHAN